MYQSSDHPEVGRDWYSLVPRLCGTWPGNEVGRGWYSLIPRLCEMWPGNEVGRGWYSLIPRLCGMWPGNEAIVVCRVADKQHSTPYTSLDYQCHIWS